MNKGLLVIGDAMNSRMITVVIILSIAGFIPSCTPRARGRIPSQRLALNQNLTANELLIAATHFGDIDTVGILLDNGADVNCTDSAGHTPLHKAAIHGHYYIAKLLLFKGATIDPRDQQGNWTPLHWAADRGHSSIATLLIAKGADINAHDKAGLTPLDWAVCHGHSTTATCLIARGAHLSQAVAEKIQAASVKLLI